MSKKIKISKKRIAGHSLSENTDITEALLDELRLMAVGIYFFLIFGIFPLYIQEGYLEIGFAKFQFFLYATVPFLAVMFLTGLIIYLRKPKEERKIAFGRLDKSVGIYSVCMVLSFLFAPNRQAAWMGASGWYMGVVAQALFVLVYFAVSYAEIPVNMLIGCNAAGSAVCFLICILQRIGYNPLNLYGEIADIISGDFIATIGNRTWFSGYACAVAPVGIYLCWKAEDRKSRILWGGYSILAFGGLTASHSDSAYIGLTAVLFAIFVVSIGDGKRLAAFFRLLALLFGSGFGISLLRVQNKELAVPTRGIAKLVFRTGWMATGLLLSIVLWIAVWAVCRHREKNRGAVPSQSVRRLQTGCVSVVCAAVLLAVAFVSLNTSGISEKWFSFTVHNPYFIFSDEWGDMRGWTWKMTCRMFGELPILQKIFGVGADCYGYYAYAVSKYAEEFARIWTDTPLVNAHNEWMNMIFCQGLLGGIAYLGIFIAGAIRFIRSKAHPLVPAVGLCVLAYMAHDFFCYQQICAAGPIFVLMGAASVLDKKYYKEGKL